MLEVAKNVEQKLPILATEHSSPSSCYESYQHWPTRVKSVQENNLHHASSCTLRSWPLAYSKVGGGHQYWPCSWAHAQVSMTTASKGKLLMTSAHLTTCKRLWPHECKSLQDKDCPVPLLTLECWEWNSRWSAVTLNAWLWHPKHCTQKYIILEAIWPIYFMYTTPWATLYS